MKWLLDTNALSELTKPAPAIEPLDWLEANEAGRAIHYGLTVVTRNREDFLRPVVSPWGQESSR